jgi:Fe-S cluster biogenesis protein NfuA
MSQDAAYDKVKAALAEVRQGVQRISGSEIELVAVDDGVVKIRVNGDWAGCCVSPESYKHFIEWLLKQRLPEVSEVIAVD